MSVAGVGYSVPPMPLPGDFRGTSKQNYSTSQTETRIKPQTIRSTTEKLQRISNAINRKLQFIVDHNSNEVIVKVIDKETDKVIREIPAEELQKLHRNLKEAIGLFFDEMV